MTRDEREETGLRAVLNFGHTIGHAIEAVAGYDGPYQHGEAVAVGMVAEARLAERLGWIGADAVDRLIRLLERFGLPTSAPGLDRREALVAAMARDKKNRGGKIRFVLPRSIGKVELTDAASLDDVRAVLCDPLNPRSATKRGATLGRIRRRSTTARPDPSGDGAGRRAAHQPGAARAVRVGRARSGGVARATARRHGRRPQDRREDLASPPGLRRRRRAGLVPAHGCRRALRAAIRSIRRRSRTYPTRRVSST